jgi:4-aminobutyrate aminotransferase
MSLERLRRRYPVLGDVRGVGLMVAAEFSRGPDRVLDGATARAVQKACLEQGLLLMTCGPFDQTIRFIPPLIVTEPQLEEGLAIFEKAVTSVSSARGSA